MSSFQLAQVSPLFESVLGTLWIIKITAAFGSYVSHKASTSAWVLDHLEMGHSSLTHSQFVWVCVKVGVLIHVLFMWSNVH